MMRQPPIFTLPHTLFPYTTLFRSARDHENAFGDFGGRQDASADRYRATSHGVIEHQRRGGLGGEAHLGVLPDVDDVIREFAVRSAVHRDGNDIEAAVHRKRFQNGCKDLARATALRSEEHTSELQSLMRNSYAVF